MSRKTDKTAKPTEATPEQLTDEDAEAVQGGATARTTNNLKQIGLALHNYHDTPSELPAVLPAVKTR